MIRVMINFRMRASSTLLPAFLDLLPLLSTSFLLLPPLPLNRLLLRNLTNQLGYLNGLILQSLRIQNGIMMYGKLMVYFVDLNLVFLDFKEGKEEGAHDIEWEMRHWFDRTAPSLRWAESTPDKTWPDLSATFPRLCLLARRFLCIVPTCAPSERVWSGCGHVITDQSSTIDSNIAIQAAFLRFNRDLIPAIPLCRA